MALVGVGPGPVEHVLAVRVVLQVQRAGGDAARRRDRMRDELRRPARRRRRRCPSACSASRYSWRMNGVADGCASSSAFHCAASIAGGIVEDPDDIIVRTLLSLGCMLICQLQPSVKVALAQINATVGDLAGNARKIVDAARAAHAQGARVVLTPELACAAIRPKTCCCGRPSCRPAPRRWPSWRASWPIATGCIVVVGHPHQFGERGDLRSKLGRGAAALQRGLGAGRRTRARDLLQARAAELPGVRRAALLRLGPRCGPGRRGVRGRRRALRRSASARTPGSTSRRALAKAAGAQVLCVLNASPFHLGKVDEREAAHGRARARRAACRCCTRTWSAGRTKWCSTAPRSRSMRTARVARARADVRRGAGCSSRSAPTARCAATSRRCRRSRRRPGRRSSPACATTSARTASRASIIGLSGGIDSALVLAIAVDALGADRVRTVMMPSPYTADISWIDARDMAAAPGRALRRDRDRADVRRVSQRSLAQRVRRPAGRRDRREHPGAHPRHAADGAVEQVRRDRADHRQQERDGDRLLHAVRRHGRRLRGDQGRREDAGLPPGALEERAATRRRLAGR